jgi:hypothetical protein
MRFLQLQIFHKSECNDYSRQLVLGSRFHRILLSLLHREIDEIIEKIIHVFWMIYLLLMLILIKFSV